MHHPLAILPGPGGGMRCVDFRDTMYQLTGKDDGDLPSSFFRRVGPVQCCSAGLVLCRSLDSRAAFRHAIIPPYGSPEHYIFPDHSC